MSFKITGTLVLVYETEIISDRFQKRDFVIEVVNPRNVEWNDFIKFQITQDRCEILDAFNIGDNLDINFNIKGRAWERDGITNYFSNLECWRVVHAVERTEDPPQPKPTANKSKTPPPPPPEFRPGDYDESDDLPF